MLVLQSSGQLLTNIVPTRPCTQGEEEEEAKGREEDVHLVASELLVGAHTHTLTHNTACAGGKDKVVA